MKIKNILSKSYYKLRLGIETPGDILFKILFFIINPFSNVKRWRMYSKYFENKLINKHVKDGVIHYKDICLPDFSHNDKFVKGFISTYYDIIFFYNKRNDKYDLKSLDMYEKIIGTEGTYCYEDGECEMVIKKGDVVIDAGAWIGAFSAYASRKGASVYAFEPSLENRKYLEKTAELNGNITVIPFALNDTTTTLDFSEDKNFIGGKIENRAPNGSIVEAVHKVQTITLDEFAKGNDIKIDFIKADIEGSERNMLLGATEVLKKYAPKLSICTYHLPDDKEVISKIITDANPKYKIIQRKKKLYGYV